MMMMMIMMMVPMIMVMIFMGVQGREKVGVQVSDNRGVQASGRPDHRRCATSPNMLHVPYPYSLFVYGIETYRNCHVDAIRNCHVARFGTAAVLGTVAQAAGLQPKPLNAAATSPSLFL